MKKIIVALAVLCAMAAGSCRKNNAAAKTPTVPSMTAARLAVPAFTTQDLDGNTVTNALFSRADVTVLNVWGTFCPPCIAEMPELGAWADAMPKNVQIVGLISDVRAKTDKDGIADARKILSDAHANFVNLIANADFSSFLQGVQFVPTTFLVDRDGVVIGEPIVGAQVPRYKQAVENYLGT